MFVNATNDHRLFMLVLFLSELNAFLKPEVYSTVTLDTNKVRAAAAHQKAFLIVTWAVWHRV